MWRPTHCSPLVERGTIHRAGSCCRWQRERAHCGSGWRMSSRSARRATCGAARPSRHSRRIHFCRPDFRGSKVGSSPERNEHRAPRRQCSFVVSVAMDSHTAARCSPSARQTSPSVERCTTRRRSRHAPDADARSPTRAHSSKPIGPRKTVSQRSIGIVRSGAPNAITSVQRCSPSGDETMRGANTSARVSTGGGQSFASSSRNSIAMEG